MKYNQKNMNNVSVVQLKTLAPLEKKITALTDMIQINPSAPISNVS